MEMIILKDKVFFSGKVAEVKAYLCELTAQYQLVSDLIKAKLN